jgi:hypothetical protein
MYILFEITILIISTMSLVLGLLFLFDLQDEYRLHRMSNSKIKSYFLLLPTIIMGIVCIFGFITGVIFAFNCNHFCV